MNIIVQCCGLTMLFVILYLYMVQRKLNFRSSRTFMGIWSIIVLSLFLDIYVLYLLANADKYDACYICDIFKWHLASYVWTALYGLMYVLLDAYKNKHKHYIIRTISVITAIVVTAIIKFLDMRLLDASEGKGNVAGPSVIFSYISAFCVMNAIVIVLWRKKDSIKPQRSECVRAWIKLWFVAAIGQTISKDFLFMGFASAIGIMIMFIKLENPNNYLDRDTGLFNISAFSTYMRQAYMLKKNYSILQIRYTFNFKESISYETEIIINTQIVEYVKSFKEAIVFLESEKEFLFVFKSERYARECFKDIMDRFSKPWGTQRLRKANLEWQFIPTTELLERAEDILPVFQYAAQNRNHTDMSNGIIIDNDVIKEMYEEKAIEAQIIKALDENRVEVFYQPIYSVKDKSYTSAEALVRIRDENGNIVSPGSFIHVAEKKGLIIGLGEEVFRQVCKFIAEYKPQEYGIEYIEVNLSVIQCAYEHLAEDFLEILKKYDIDPKLIILEITETASVREKNILLNNMKKLREIGIRFALDDFGTGQSNLNYIVEMPVDVVKFDNTMIKAYFDNGTAKYVMDAAMHMIQGMELQIVSEGIEKKEQYKTMEALGIDYIQGYYFSKPVEKSAFIELIKQGQ